MEKVRKISKKYYVRQIMACWLVLWMGLGLPLQVAMAVGPDPGTLPSGGVVQYGAATFDTGTPNELHVRDVAQETIIHWDSFDIASDALTQFHQLGVNPAVLNRIMTGGASEIFGALLANGRVFVVNPAGVIFGPGATVNVNQLVASALPMTNDDFLAAATDASVKMKFGPGSGDVTIMGTLDATGSDSLYFVGENVFNDGAIICPDGLVVMAAGDEMLLGQPGSDVIVALGDLTADGDNDVVNDGTVGGSSVDKLVLAAGDVWSQAISNVRKLKVAATETVTFEGDVSAYAGAGSDAVAEVDIEVDGDFTVDDYSIEAVAVGNGVDNAYATVTIDAAGDVEVLGDLDPWTESVKAEASGGVDNEANVNITGSNVTVRGEWEIGFNDATVQAEAHDGVNNTAGVTITADGIEEDGNVVLEAEGWHDDALILAKAQDGTNNTATVDIDANGDVEVTAEGEAAAIKALAKNDIVFHYGDSNPFIAEDLVNTATVDISGTNVYVRAEDHQKATISATAANEIMILADEEDDADFDVTIRNLENNATVLIAATEDVVVEAGHTDLVFEVEPEPEEETTLGDVEILAEAKNEIQLGKEGHFGQHDHEYFDVDLVMEDLVNNALVDIDATENIRVTADGWDSFWFWSWESEAEVQANAYNELRFGDSWDFGPSFGDPDDWFVFGVTANVIADNLTNNADVLMTAANGNVEVGAVHGGEALVEAKAYNRLGGDFDAEMFGDNQVWLTVDNVANDALVDIEAGGDVVLTALCEPDCSLLEILAAAWNDVTEPENTPENITNTSKVEITGANVEVSGIDCGEASVIADSHVGTSNTADVVIGADGTEPEDGNVDIKADVKALAYYGGSADSTVDIDATGDVDIEPYDGDTILAEAEAWGTTGGVPNNSNATVDIAAGGDVNIDEHVKAESDAEDHAGDGTATVNITAGGDVHIGGGFSTDIDISGGDYLVEADTWVDEDSGNAAANVNISSTGTIEDGVYIYDRVKAEADTREMSGSATAGVDIASNGDVLIGGEDTVKAEAVVEYPDPQYAGDATANVNVNAGGNIDVEDDVKATAEVEHGAGNSTAGIVLNAGEDVVIVDRVKAEADAKEHSGDATATVDIDAGGSAIIGEGECYLVEADAYAGDNSGNATAEVDITSTGTEEEDGVFIYDDVKADADTREHSGNATSSVDITSSGDVVIDGEQTVKAEAVVEVPDAQYAGDATANVNINADGDIGVYDNVEAEAEVWHRAGNSTAGIVLNAGGIVDIQEQVKAEADAEDHSGDATATVDIDAKGVVIGGLIEPPGDIEVSNDGKLVEADTWVTSDSGNATATVDITSTGTEFMDGVEVFGDVKADADTRENSGSASATVNITAASAEGGVIIEGEDSVKANAVVEYPDPQYAGDATANVNINTAGNVVVEDNVEAEAEAIHGAGNSTAGIVINAGGDVYIDDHVKAEADAEDHSGDAAASVDVDAGGFVLIGQPPEPAGDIEISNGDYLVEADAYAGDDSGNATADVDITSTGTDEEDGVFIYDDIKADADSRDLSGSATSSIDIISSGDVVIETVECTVKAEAVVDSPDPQYEGNATANVNIDADGNVNIDDKVKAEAEATNYAGNATAGITIDAGGNVDIYDDVEAYSYTDEGSGNADSFFDVYADIDLGIHERDGDTVKAKAEAYDSGDATADGVIGAGGSVTIDHKVKAIAKAKDSSGNASSSLAINAGTDVTINEWVQADADATVGSGNADSTIGINAGGNVTVTDYVEAMAGTRDASGDATAGLTVDAANVTVSDGTIEADAEADNSSGDATATVDITTTSSDVVVENDSEIHADADTSDASGDAKATLTIAADNVTVSDGSEIEATADTEDGSDEAEASVDIDADGEVLVENNSKIMAWASTYNYSSGDATATVDIDATGSVTVIGHEGGEVSESGGDSSKILAHAMTERAHDQDSSGDATAGVDIAAGDDVIALRSGKIAAVAVVKDGDGDLGPSVSQDSDPGITMLETVNATATVDVVAADDVYVSRGSDLKAVALILNGEEMARGLSGGPPPEGDHPEEILLVPGDATASVAVDAGGNVTVEKGSELSAEAGIHHDSFFDVFPEVVPSVENGENGHSATGDATATVDVDAGGDVTVQEGGELGAYAWIDNYVHIIEGTQLSELEFPEIGDLGDATANTNILAGGDVTVSKGGEVYADAELYNSSEGMLDGIGSLEDGEFELPGLGDATAGIVIDADGSLTVDKGGDVYAEASIEYGGEFGPKMLALDEEADKESGDATASIDIDAFEGVTVGKRGAIEADAWIDTYAFGGESLLLQVPEIPSPMGSASASVDIQTCGDVIVDGLVGAYADIYTEWVAGDIEPSMNGYNYSGDTSATVDIRAYGDVVVNSEEEEDTGELDAQYGGPRGGRIKAIAHGGYDNSADITILAAGDVIVNDARHPIRGGEIDSSFMGSREEILAMAFNGHTNSAHIGIATRGDGLHPESLGDITVDGQIGAHTWDGWENTSDVEICAAQDVIVDGGYALYELISEGELEVSNGPVYTEAGGRILAEASSGGRPHEGEPEVFNTANVEIYAGRDVIVHEAEVEYLDGESTDLEALCYGDVEGGQILALTPPYCYNNNSENTSTIGIYAGRDVIVEGPPMESLEMLMDGDLAGLIEAGAHGNSSINTALIDICAQDDVLVDGEIIAEAGTGINGVAHNAHITIAAGNADPGGPGGGGIAGSGYIEADADENAKEHAESITFYATALGNFNFAGITIPEADEIVVPVVDCPDCPFEWVDWAWCEDCEAEITPAMETAPIMTLTPPPTPPVEFGPGGCPLLMGWLADELGVGVDIQVVVANALAYSTDCQPCDAAARLQDAARILADQDGSHMAAMNTVFNELAPADAPFTPEMGAAIVTAFAGRVGDGTPYATAIEFIDAFVQYIAILNTELGSPVGDSVAFVMGRYGTGITGSDNGNLAAFLATRMEAGETFAP